jgi:hypothetical protein
MLSQRNEASLERYYLYGSISRSFAIFPDIAFRVATRALEFQVRRPLAEAHDPPVLHRDALLQMTHGRR